MIHKPFLVTVEFENGKVLRFAEPTRSRMRALAAMYSEFETVKRVTMYDGAVFESKQRITKNGYTNYLTLWARAVKDAKVSWMDADGRRKGTICVEGSTLTREGEVAYHVRDEEGEWYIIPAWALTPEYNPQPWEKNDARSEGVAETLE